MGRNLIHGVHKDSSKISLKSDLKLVRRYFFLLSIGHIQRNLFLFIVYVNQYHPRISSQFFVVNISEAMKQTNMLLISLEKYY